MRGKIIAAAITIFTVAALSYWIFIADRELWSLKGVSKGDTMQNAHRRLNKAGYLRIRPSDDGLSGNLCDQSADHVFIFAGGPTFSYNLTVSEFCRVESITRRLRSGP